MPGRDPRGILATTLTRIENGVSVPLSERLKEKRSYLNNQQRYVDRFEHFPAQRRSLWGRGPIEIEKTGRGGQGNSRS